MEKTNHDFQFSINDGHERSQRVKRAQGPITELYRCMLTLFLNPFCWNRFENNRLRYLQYLYLRRRLHMMEEAMKNNKTMSAGGDSSAQSSELPRGSSPPESESSSDSESTTPASSRLARIGMKLFPKRYGTIVEMLKRVQGLQKQIMNQAQQLIRRIRPQPQPEAPQALQAPFPIMMMRT